MIIPKKKSYKVLEVSELEYCRNKINNILFLCLFVNNPKKKKKKSYKVLKLGELEYCRNKINNILCLCLFVNNPKKKKKKKLQGTQAW